MKKTDSGPPEKQDTWKFILYVAGRNVAGQRAESALHKLCDHYLPDRHTLEIVDFTDPSATMPPDVLAVPTAIRAYPRPERRVIGDLSDLKKAAQGLGLTEEPFL